MVATVSSYCSLKVEGIDVSRYLMGFDGIRDIIMCPIPDFKVTYMNVKASFPREDDSDIAVVLPDFIEECGCLVACQLKPYRVEVVRRVSIPRPP